MGSLTTDQCTELKDNGDNSPVQAVTVFEHGDIVWCSVARNNKKLSIYRLESLKEVSAEPYAVHETVKRVSCLDFCTLNEALVVALAGDLAGDAWGFSCAPGVHPKDDLEVSSHQRLLLGHTASMLTGLRVVQHDGIWRILTSDRDEKIRVSSFPQTFQIEGFLLGHDAYVSSFDVASVAPIVASCSGDLTLRMWDYVNGTELAEVPTMSKEEDSEEKEEGGDIVPTKLAINSAATAIALVYDENNTLDVWGFDMLIDPTERLHLRSRTELSMKPLGIAFLDDSTLLTVNEGPNYLQAYIVDKEGALSPHDLPLSKAIASILADCPLQLPTSVLERDDHGHIKMQKLCETRNERLHWNDVKRRKLWTERNRRRNKRLKSVAQEG